MTETTPAPASIARQIWDSARRKPAFMSALLGTAGILWLTGIAFTLGTAILRRHEGLVRVAPQLMTASWFTGFALNMLAQSLLSPDSAADQRAEHRRGRIRRWLGSKDATFVDISGKAHQRAVTSEVSKASAAQPSMAFVAMPILTVLGTACIGFAGAMLVAKTFAAPRSPVSEDFYFDFLPWAILLPFFLWTSLQGVGGASLRVHAWARERAAAGARARADVERARLGALQAQMNPRFLFTTLNTVAALAAPDSARAERVVEHLSAVLRHSLQRADQPFTSVDDEVRFTREYLEVEQERLGAGLRVTWDIAANTLPLRVPTACIQPLVENAITYAIESRTAGGHVLISTTTTASGYMLRLSVEDDGPGFPADMQDGHGLGDLRHRLHAEYGRTCELDTETLPAGARVTISVPATPFDADVPAARQETRP